MKRDYYTCFFTGFIDRSAPRGLPREKLGLEVAHIFKRSVGVFDAEDTQKVLSDLCRCWMI